MKKYLKTFKWYEIVFFFISLASLITIGIIFQTGNTYVFVYELCVTLFGLLACFLNCKRTKWAFIFYTLYALTYGISAIFSKQYGEGALNLLFNLPLYIYTTVKLFKNKSNNQEFKINTIPKKILIIIIVLIPVIGFAYSFLLYFLKSGYPLLNALATAIALASAFAASKAYKEQRIFWILYSVVLSTLWALNFFLSKSGGIMYLVLNCIYLVINVYACINWYIEAKKMS